jgi:hypothetical protein
MEEVCVDLNRKLSLFFSLADMTEGNTHPRLQLPQRHDHQSLPVFIDSIVLLRYVFAFHFSRLALFVHQAYVLYIMDCNPVLIDLAAEKPFTVEASPPYAAPRVHHECTIKRRL